MTPQPKPNLDELEARARAMTRAAAPGELAVKAEVVLSLIAAARESEAVKRDAGRMHYLGNLIRTKEQAEWDELRALMRRYPPVTAPPEPTNGR